MSKKPKKDKAEGLPEEEGEVKKKGGIVPAIIGFVLITAIAGGLGFATSMFLLPSGDKAHMAAADGEHAKKDEHKVEEEEHGEEKAEHGDDEETDGPTMFGHAKSIPAILTNLASPKTTWVRLEVALVTDGELAEELPDQIHQDFMAFMRTVKLRHIQGPSGFLTLKAELNDRAAIRSEGSVKQVLIKTLLFE